MWTIVVGIGLVVNVPLAGAFSAPSLSPDVAITHSRGMWRSSAAPARMAQSDTGAKSTGTAIGSYLSSVALGAVLLGGFALRRRASAKRGQSVCCNAFGSSGSGFYGSSTVTSIAFSTPAPPQPGSQPSDSYEARQGVASMGMGNQKWWITHNGYDNHRSGKIFDWKRRESRRRGEELFRHDVDNFEITLFNIIRAPGSHRKSHVRGRGMYNQYGGTCGYGQNGAKSRGQGTVNRGFEGAQKPHHLKIPKLDKAQIQSGKRQPYTPLDLSVLNMCEDGDEVDFQDLQILGFPVKTNFKYGHIKVTGKDEDEFKVKNLTVYAHAFEPPAREKIESLGGRCVRLHPLAGIPVEDMVAVDQDS